MSDPNFVTEYLAHVRAVLDADDLQASVSNAVQLLLDTRNAGRKVMFAGNGASASLASHYALDFTKQADVRSVSFNDVPLITAYANDYGFDKWVARAMQHHGEAGDVAILISSSGTSPNMLEAADGCRELGIRVLSFTGFDATNPLRQRSDIGFWAESRAYNVIEAVHAVWLGLLCDLIVGSREYGVKG